MRKIDQLQSCLNSALDRKYFLRRWICDDSLVTILKNNYEINFLTKSYLNKYIQIVFLRDYKRYDYSFHRLKNDKNEIIYKTYFYYFTRSTDTPKFYTTKEEWQQVRDNFRILRCSTTQQLTSTKRKEISLNNDYFTLNSDEESTDSGPNVITPPNFRRRLTILDIIGDYYSSSEGKILFNCKQNESVYDCLSRRIDRFNMIINNKICISTIVNKAKEKDCEMSSYQTILILNRIQYLKHAVACSVSAYC